MSSNATTLDVDGVEKALTKAVSVAKAHSDARQYLTALQAQGVYNASVSEVIALLNVHRPK